MKKIAIIISDSLSDRKGQLNAELNRIKYLKQTCEFQIDVYCFGIYEGWLTRFLRHTKEIPLPEIANIDGIPIRCFWRRFSLIDYVLEVKMHRSPIVNANWMKKYAYLFRHYDLISAHSLECGMLARWVSKLYNIPFCVSWHGSDIHRGPFENPSQFLKTKDIIIQANCNFFVSKALLETSNFIASEGNKTVLYNGVNESFMCFDNEHKNALRRHYGVHIGQKVIAFVGNLLDIKNPMLLVPIFSAVRKKYDDKVLFWVVGDGKFHNDIAREAKIAGVQVLFFGNQPVEKMPDIMNCIDVLVLPSKNEGLPLVVLEAMACGVNVVGSNVGGIPEAIGNENVYTLGPDFVDKISDRIVEMLNVDVQLSKLDSKFDWKVTADKESAAYMKILE